MRTLNDGLLTGRQAEVGKWSVFAAADGGDFDIGAGGGTPGLKSNMNTLALGVTVRASDNVTLGAAYGRSRLHASFGNDTGNFRTYENSVSAFASLKWGGFYGTGLVSLADVEYNETQRKIVLGPLTRVATSNPEGSNVSSYFTAGYDFPIGRFMIGPAVTLTTANVDVNQFDEQGAGSANLRIGAQKRKSEIWGVGVRASAQFGAWTPYVRITADKERRDQARYVTATPLTMIATANSYDLPAYASDNSFMTTTAGVSGWIMPNVALSIAYYKVSNRSGIREDAIGGTVSVKF